MAEKFFVHAKKLGILGLLFTMSGLDNNALESLDLSTREKGIMSQARVCVEYMRDTGVPKKLLENTKQKSSLETMSHLPIEKKKQLTLKFLRNIARDSTMEEKINSLRQKTNKFIFPRFEKETTHWQFVEIADDDGESVRSGLDAYSISL
jgi:hypothetical protein